MNLGNLRYGYSKRCRACSTSRRFTTHGATAGKKEDRLYRIWKAMKWRCSSANVSDYKDYFARGIRVCDDWYGSYEMFRDWAMANGYRKDLSIDRVNNLAGYGPENCRWANGSQQASNTRRNRLMTAFGETKIMSRWAEDPRCVVRQPVLSMRKRRGWGDEEAITTPARKPRPRT